MRTSSAMMNPFEFRESMWTILYKGEEPPQRDRPKPPPPRAPSRRGRRGAAARPSRPSKPGPARRFTRREASALDAFNREILALQEKQRAQQAQAAE